MIRVVRFISFFRGWRGVEIFDFLGKEGVCFKFGGIWSFICVEDFGWFVLFGDGWVG